MYFSIYIKYILNILLKIIIAHYVLHTAKLFMSSHLHLQQLCKVGAIVIFITDERTAS